MARLTFPSDRLVYTASAYAGSAFTSAANAVATVYSDSAGTTLADVQNFDGSANATATFTVDTTSRLPLFLGPPAGTDTLYVKVGTGPVTAIYAVTSGDISAAIGAEVTNRQAADALLAKPRGAWVTATAYAVNDVVTSGGAPYRCLTAHTSGASFSGAGVNWESWGSAAAYAATDSLLKINAGKVAVSQPNHLRRWRRALNKASLRQAAITLYGTSLTLGAYANDLGATNEPVWRTQGYAALLRDLFGAKFGRVGEGWIGFDDITQLRWTLGGAAAFSAVRAADGIGPFGWNLHLWAATDTAQVTITVPAGETVTTLKVHVWVGYGANYPISYQIDGGSTVPINGNARIAAGSVGEGDYTETVTGLSLTEGTHTIKVYGPSASSAKVIGLQVLNTTTSGVRVDRIGGNGLGLADLFAYAVSGSWGLDATSQLRQWDSAYTILGPPDLAVLEMSANNNYGEWQSFQVTPAQFQTNLQTVVTKMVTAGSAVLLVGGPQVDPTWLAANPTTPVNPNTQAQYDAAMAAVAAATDHCAYVSIDTLWTDYATSNADGLRWDYVHPNSFGHPDLARFLFDCLGGAGGGSAPVNDTGTLPSGVQVTLDLTATAAAYAGSWDVAYSTIYPGNQVAYNYSTAQNDAITFDVWLPAGTYTLDLFDSKNPDAAIITVKVDGSSVGTLDAYAAGQVPARQTLTGVAVATTGKHAFQFVAATKNGASSGYVLRLSRAILTRV